MSRKFGILAIWTVVSCLAFVSVYAQNTQLTHLRHKLLVSKEGFRFSVVGEKARFIPYRHVELWEIERTLKGWLFTLEVPTGAKPKYLCSREADADDDEVVIASEKVTDRCYWQIESSKSDFGLVGFIYQIDADNRRVYLGHGDKKEMVKVRDGKREVQAAVPILTRTKKPEFEFTFENEGA